MAKVMRRSRGALTQAVLPLSSKWLMGQGVEAGLAGPLVAGAGPADLLRFNKVVKKMNAAKAGSGDELLMRVSGGQFGLTGTAREFAQGQRSLADEFAGTSLERVGNAATKVGTCLPAKAVRKGWGKYTNVVLDSVNGVLENTPARRWPARRSRTRSVTSSLLTGLSDKALEDAAKGLTGTELRLRWRVPSTGCTASTRSSARQAVAAAALDTVSAVVSEHGEVLVQGAAGGSSDQDRAVG
jgi:hypothetical protein